MLLQHVTISNGRSWDQCMPFRYKVHFLTGRQFQYPVSKKTTLEVIIVQLRILGTILGVSISFNKQAEFSMLIVMKKDELPLD